MLALPPQKNREEHVGGAHPKKRKKCVA